MTCSAEKQEALNETWNRSCRCVHTSSCQEPTCNYHKGCLWLSPGGYVWRTSLHKLHLVHFGSISWSTKQSRQPFRIFLIFIRDSRVLRELLTLTYCLCSASKTFCDTNSVHCLTSMGAGNFLLRSCLKSLRQTFDHIFWHKNVGDSPCPKEFTV